ncbi:Aldo/keto reductase family protein [Oopsacas minuta]|uniref:Aldo/keto reductase family protein n=1 Tax=Oopsacas minuta TaxID=111878 RepID=A0AAV7K328_9METZ|nr:Aldo/keto reductase family protein [Oopsacas minuta]
MASSSKELAIDSIILLNDGVKIPTFGLGVYQSHPGDETYEAVLHAIKTGYLCIDTAALYKNEKDVGRAIRDSKVTRENIFITTKLWTNKHGTKTIEGFHESLKQLDLKYIDLYLMHSPRGGNLVETWQSMLNLKSQGLVRSIGVSNFGIHHLEELKRHFPNFPPSVNQIEISPYSTRKELVEYCKNNDILVQAYSPLTKGIKLNDSALVAIAKKYSKTTAQILIRWSLQRGYQVIPKSVKKIRIEENAQIFDFSITEDDMIELDSYNINLVTGWDPTNDPLM